MRGTAGQRRLLRPVHFLPSHLFRLIRCITLMCVQALVCRRTSILVAAFPNGPNTSVSQITVTPNGIGAEKTLHLYCTDV